MNTKKQIIVNTFDKQKPYEAANFKKTNLTASKNMFNYFASNLAMDEKIPQKPIDRLSTELSSILGWEELDARIYLNILRHGSITASALAKELDMDRTKMYRTVNKLLGYGVVSTTLSYPKLCVATPPKEVIEIILQKKENEIKRIKECGEGIIGRIDKISPNYVNDMPKFSTAQGLSNIFSFIEKLIETSSDIVYIVTTLKNISRMYHTNIPDKIKICEKNGGQVRLLTELNDGGLKLYLNRFHSTETKIGHIPSKGILVVSKDKQMIISESSMKNYDTTAKPDAALCTNSHELVNNIFILCTLLWKNSKSLETLKARGKKL